VASIDLLVQDHAGGAIIVCTIDDAEAAGLLIDDAYPNSIIASPIVRAFEAIRAT
jgi:hypothetical protein